MMKLPRQLIQKFFCLILVIYCQSSAAIEIGDYLQLGKLQTVQGQTFDQSHWDQRNTLVQVWATWCGYCHRQNKNLDQLSKKIPLNSLNIVTISVDRSIEPVRSYLRDHQYDFPVVMMDARLSAAIGKRRGVPELYVLDKNGRVIQKYFGQMVDVDFYDLVRYSKSTDTPNPTPKLSR